MRLTIFLVILLFLIITADEAMAATFRLDPLNASIPIGQAFVVNVYVDTQGARSTSADLRLIYDPSTIEVVAVNNGSFYEKYLHTVVSPNIFLSGGNRSAAISGAGLLGSIVLRAKGFGVTSLRFDCKGATLADFINIENENRDDIVECAALESGVYTFTVPAGMEVYDLFTSTNVSPSPPPTFRGLLAKPYVSKAPTQHAQISGVVQGVTAERQAISKDQGIPAATYAVGSIALLLFGIVAIIVAIAI